MEIIIKCSDDVRGGTNIYGEPIRELVRCRECKWYNGRMAYKCRFHISRVNADDFCSYGEREGE